MTRASEVRIALVAWMLTGAAVGSAASRAALALNPSVRSAHDALAFCLLASIVYASLFVPFGLVAGLLRARALRGRADAQRGTLAAHVALALLAFAAFALGEWSVANESWRTDAHPTSVLVGLACAAAVLGVASIASARPIAVRAAAASRWLPALTLAALGFSSASAWNSRRGAESEVLPPSASLPKLERGGRKLLLLGIDGIDGRRLDRLFAEGRLQHLRALSERGLYAPLASFHPTWSPILWNTAATGVSGERHGVLDFTEIALPGLDAGVQRLRRGALLPRFTGLAPIVQALVWSGVLEETTISGSHRRYKAVWNVLSDAGLRVAVDSWYASWPAEQLDGWVIGDVDPRRYAAAARALGSDYSKTSGVTWPPELIAELAQLGPDEFYAADRVTSTATMLDLPVFRDLTPPERDELARVHEAQKHAGPQEGVKTDLLRLAFNVYERDRFAAEAAVHLLRTKSPDFLALYVLSTDNLSHCLSDRTGLVDRTYEFVDDIVGRCVEAAGPDTDVIVMSDHGWSYAGGDFGHMHGPDGVLIMAGPSIARGATLERKPELYDIAPTVLALCGLPKASYMRGRALLEAFVAERNAAAPRDAIASFGPYVAPARRTQGEGEARKARGEDVQRLKALGYVE